VYTFITGASSGIGYALAYVFARHKHDLVLVARSQAKLENLAEHIRKTFTLKVEVMVSDLSKPDAVPALVEQIQKADIKIDVLVNNAGVDVYGYFYDTDWQRELAMLQLNLISLTQLTKLLLPGMRERGNGRILNLGSNGSFIPAPLNAVYAATKAYIWNFSAALAEELRGSGVTVTALCPGATRTDFQARVGMEDVRLLRFGVMEAAAVAEDGYRGLMAGKLLVVPGWFTKLQIFLARFLPMRFLTRMAKVMLEPTS
jgi:short-subunit dehydrogenase